MASEAPLQPPRRYRAAARFLLRSLTLRGSSFLLALMAVSTGATLTATMLNLKADLGAKMSRELRRYGPNLLVTPGSAIPSGSTAPTLDEAAAGRIPSILAAGGRSAPATISPLLIASGRLRAAAGTSRATPSPATLSALDGPVAQGLAPRGAAAATIVGTEFEALRRMYPAWQVDGAWPGARACLVGASLAKRAGLAAGQSVIVVSVAAAATSAPPPVSGSAAAASPVPSDSGAALSTPRSFSASEPDTARSVRPSPTSPILEIAGILSTGEAEDEQVFVPLEFLQEQAGLTGRISLVALSVDGGTETVETAARALEAALPGCAAHALRQVASAQGAILGKLGRMMVLLTTVVLTLSALCLTTTLMSIVIEREREIGLMRSIGAGDGEILTMFFGEVSLLGMLGGVIGLVLGAACARLIGTSLFDSAVQPRAVVIPIVLGGSVAMCLISVLLPLRRALRIQPAAALRGE